MRFGNMQKHVFYRTGATWRSKWPLGPARAPPVRSKGLFEPASAHPVRSKWPLRPAPVLQVRSKRLLWPAAAPPVRSKMAVRARSGAASALDKPVRARFKASNAHSKRLSEPAVRDHYSKVLVSVTPCPEPLYSAPLCSVHGYARVHTSRYRRGNNACALTPTKNTPFRGPRGQVP